MHLHTLEDRDAEALEERGRWSRTRSDSDHDPIDPSIKHTAPPSSAHVQLDDDPRAPIQQSFRDEFRQHDGVVMMMMLYRRRASPKLRDDMTEVEYGGGGHRTRLRNDP